MIKKSNEHYIPKLLTEFKELIKTEMGFDLNFTQKQMNEGYTIEQIKEAQILKEKQKPINEDENINESQENYYDIKAEFELKNFKVNSISSIKNSISENFIKKKCLY